MNRLIYVDRSRSSALCRKGSGPIDRGKLPKVALVTAMRKLLLAVYGVGKSRRPFVRATRARPRSPAGASPPAVTVMVPNSLGPAELILHYGTEEQKRTLLPRLATGEEIPCFALTGPEAGSDAAAEETLLGRALAAGIIAESDRKALQEADDARDAAIQVDDFAPGAIGARP